MALAWKMVDLETCDWDELNRFPDRTIFQTPAWLEFISRSQHATPVVARLHDDGRTVGYFTGLIVRKFGLRILGSPMPGWTTSYLGFNLLPEFPRREALRGLARFAFKELGCVHVEILDRHMTLEDAKGFGYDYHTFPTYEIDLTQSEDTLFANMTSACRRCIRKAQKCGVQIEEAHDLEFADEYYAQLEEVFAKQSLVPTYERERVRELIRQVHPTGLLLLLRARNPEGRCIATGIFPAMNRTMYFWGGASWRKDQILRPNEAIQWYAMNYWKKRDVREYDMGGGGEYKKKYGALRIGRPWFRKSRFSLLIKTRDLTKKSFRIRQRLLGKLKARSAN